MAYPKLFWTDIESGGQPEVLSTEGGVQFPASWTPDGKALAYAETAVEQSETHTGWDIWLLRPGSDAPRTVLVRTPFKDDQPAFSPDGGALAYVSDETGQLEVYIRTFPDTSRRVRVSTDGGTEPVWARRGGEIFYRSGRRYFSVPVKIGESIQVGRPLLLFEGDYVVAAEIPGAPSYDVAPDGQRFLMVARASETPQPRRLELVLGWAHELERRLSGRTAP
jgi:dipeptidyl aminopeptidase/acylaminoacyl peptidase